MNSTGESVARVMNSTGESVSIINDGIEDRMNTERNKSEYFKTKHSFEDFNTLISNLLVIDTFLLGFTLTYGSSFSYDDLISSDQRYMTIWQDSSINSWFGVPKQYTLLFSVCLIYRAQMAVTFLSLSLLIGAGSVVGI